MPVGSVSDLLGPDASVGGLNFIAAIPGIAMDSVGPGYYALPSGIHAVELFRILKGKHQTPLRVVQPVFRSLEKLALFWEKNLRLNKNDLLQLWNSESFLQHTHLLPGQQMVLFMPETYEMYWTVSAEALTRKMLDAHQAFWTPERMRAADKLGLTPVEVSILASIIQEESNIPDEKPVIAGVYLNRLKKNMRLQADPTVKFAIGDFSLKRILFEHLKFDSPWNTYKYSGLPPGPINTPDQQSINAVLYAESHDFVYFCAKSDFSGRHEFTGNYVRHLQNARAYQKALDSLQSIKP